MTTPKTGMLAVIVGDACRGFLFRRRNKFECFNVDLISLGIFDDEQKAIAALFHNPEDR